MSNTNRFINRALNWLFIIVLVLVLVLGFLAASIKAAESWVYTTVQKHSIEVNNAISQSTGIPTR